MFPAFFPRRPRARRPALIFIAVLAAIIAGCSSLAQKQAYDPKIDANDFTKRVDNKYFTLTSGRTLVYEGRTDEGKERIEVTVLRKTKKVMGVETTIVWDRVWLDGELIEATKDWYAQDKLGNVWYFGEDSKEYENGKFKGAAGSWEAGVDGAKPGIIMKAEPKVGQKYRQEYYKGEAEDMAEVLALNETAVVPYGKFKDCLKTKDWTPLEPGVSEHKYYSASIGGVVLERGVESGQRIELVEVRKD